MEKQVKNILIIHTAFIGDIVLSTPLIKKIKAKYKNSRITYVTTPVGKSILKNNPNLDEIIAYDKRNEHRGIKGVMALGKKLKYKNFDLVITPHRYIRSQILSWMSGAKERIGYDNATGRTLNTKNIHYNKSLHEVDKLLSFIDLDSFQDKKIELFPSSYDESKISSIWKEHKLNGEKVIALATGSKWFTKRWPLENFNILLGKLLDSGYKVVLVGGKDELLFNIERREETLDLIGKTTLLELAEVLKRIDLVVTNDSSPIHIASAWESTHIVAIFGATVKELGFFPWSKNSEVLEEKELECRPCGLHGGKKCPKGHFKCMLNITPEQVYERIEKYFMKKEEK